MTTLHYTDEPAVLSPEIDDLLLQARGLALVRDMLAARGVSQDSVNAHTEELERVRLQLAEMIGGDLL